MHPPAQLIERFYTSFRNRDTAAMVTCYVPDATFRDPIFDLKGHEVADMWTMFCERGRDLVLEFRDVHADEHDRQGALGAALHVLGDRPAGAQHHRVALHVSRRPHRRAGRFLQPVALEPHGARSEGRRARLGAVREDGYPLAGAS